MKNEHMKTEVRSFRFSTLAVILLTIAALLCSFTVLVSAATTTTDLDYVQIGLQQDGSKVYYKEYDGNTNVTVTLVDGAQDAFIDKADQSSVKVAARAEFDEANAGDRVITVTFELAAVSAGQTVDAAMTEKYAGKLPNPIEIPAKITPKRLTWAGAVSGEVVYTPNSTTYTYTVTKEALEDLTLNGKVDPDDDVKAAASDVTATLNGITGVKRENDGTVVAYSTTVPVALAGDKAANYTVDPLTVNIKVNPLVIDQINWATEYTFVKGDKAANEIVVDGHIAGTPATDKIALKVVYANGFDNLTVGEYDLTVESPDENNIELGGSVSKTRKIKIIAPAYTVSMGNVTYIGNVGVQETPTVYQLTVAGDLPAEVLAAIKYYVNGAEFTGASAYGTYTVTAKLPEGYTFYTEANPTTPVTELTATLTINRAFVTAGTADLPYQLILINANGFAGDVSATVKIPEALNRKAIGGFKYHTEYTLTVTGANGETFTVLVPISDTLYNKRCSDLTADDIYIYDDVNGTMAKASERGYTVTLKDGYYQIDGVSGTAPITFVLAPEYNAPFWLTPWGILLIVLIVLAVLALLLLIGLYLRRIRANEAKETVIDTEGDVPAVVDAELEDKVDADAALDETLDELAEKLDGEVEAEADAENTEGVEEAVAESLQELTDEASAIELAEETALEDDTDVAAEMADAMADALQDTEAAEDAEAEADADALRAAVEEALAENFNESADASDAIVLVAAEEEVDEITPEDFRAVVDAIVSDAMCATMDIPEELVDETVEEAIEETVEEAVEESVEEAVEETVEETAEATVEETVEIVEDVVEETIEETIEETAEETAAEIVVEEMSNDDICAVVADSVAEAFELVTVDGVTPAAVEGTTVETITEAVNNAGDANIPETWTEDMAVAVKEAVVDELAARLLAVEEEPAVEAFAEVVEAVAEDDNDNDNDEDDDDSFGGFGSLPLNYIDAIEEAEQYLAMLDQERRGEIRIVTRYRKSYQARLAQSQGNVMEYYNIIKNLLLSYKGVKNRISWNYEAFNKGRVHVAKIIAKTKTLYLYLALDPAEFVDSKYGIVDVSDKKKYASVPVLMKIKGDRKFKYALELIDKLCGENLQLPKKETEEIDYRIPYQTTEELVQSGLVKKLVASVPVVYGEAPVAEEPTEAVTPATEDQTVTFVAPTDTPAVEAAAEEIAETPAEDVPAVTETTDDNSETTNV